MQTSKTHFEQIPIKVVKKIIEEVAEKKQTDGDHDVIMETPPSKTERSSVREALALRKGSLKMAAALGMEDLDDYLE